MTDRRPEHAWFSKADDDLVLARRALGPDRPLPGLACFLAQQCAEKYLKGYLVAHGVPFRFVHDLGYLIDLCTGLDPAFADLMPAAITLNPYAGAARYPAEAAQEPDIPRAQDAVRRAQQIADFVLQS
ncbi:MAG: HEPN domain-containing protein [Chloroflexi bacterium]|nr:HEPN domain-containing protein [Chloroflexota bacterium]